MKDWMISVIVGLAGLVVIVIALSWIASGDLPSPVHSDVRPPPTGFGAFNATFISGSGTLIHGWQSPGKRGQGVVLLLHASGGNRRDMLSRAQFLHAAGYAVVLFDFQSHGENRGQRVTYGDLESQDVTAALQYISHKFPGEKVGVLAASLGADAFVLAEGRPEVSAIVLEQMYPTIRQAVAGQLRHGLGPFAPLFAPLLLAEMQSRREIAAPRLRPIDRMSKLGAPLLIINGTADANTTLDDAQALLASSAAPKELWAIEGAGHVNLYDYARADYEHRITDFFARYLHSDLPPEAPGSQQPQAAEATATP